MSSLRHVFLKFSGTQPSQFEVTRTAVCDAVMLLLCAAAVMLLRGGAEPGDT